MSSDAGMSSSLRIGRFEADECRRNLLAAEAITDTDWQAAVSVARSPDNPKEILEQIGDLVSPVHFAYSSQASSFLPADLAVKLQAARPDAFRIHEYAIFLPPLDFDQQSGSELYMAWNLSLGRCENLQLYRNWEGADQRFENDLLARAELDGAPFLQLSNAGWCESSDRLEMEGMFLCYERPNYKTAKQIVDDAVNAGARLPPDRAIAIGKELAQAVASAHRRGLRCPAIMPSGIGVADTGGVAILEPHSFPIEPAQERNRLSQFLRAAPVTAPEQWLGGNVWSPASDLYGIGCTLFYLLTGRYPFVDNDLDGPIGDQHLRRTPRAPSALRSDLPDAVDDIVLQLLAKDPRDRFPSAMALAHSIGTLAV